MNLPSVKLTRTAFALCVWVGALYGFGLAELIQESQHETSKMIVQTEIGRGKIFLDGRLIYESSAMSLGVVAEVPTQEGDWILVEENPVDVSCVARYRLLRLAQRSPGGPIIAERSKTFGNCLPFEGIEANSKGVSITLSSVGAAPEPRIQSSDLF